MTDDKSNVISVWGISTDEIKRYKRFGKCDWLLAEPACWLSRGSWLTGLGRGPRAGAGSLALVGWRLASLGWHWLAGGCWLLGGGASAQGFNSSRFLGCDIFRGR